MPRILFFDFNYPELQRDSNFPVGGATVELHSWIKGFIHEGWEVGVLVSKYSEGSLDKSVRFIETYDQNYGIPKLRSLYYRIPKLYSAIEKFNPDYLYHGVTSSTSAILALISKILKIKFISRISSDFIVDERIKCKFSKLELKALKYLFRNSDYLICQNKYQLMKIQNISHKGKLTLITNPYYYNCKEIEDCGNYIAWIGIFKYVKNLKVLYEIVTNLSDYEFRIAGSSYSGIDEESKNAINNLKKCRNVKFVGYLRRQEVSDFLAKAKLLLNTSRYEGFSNTFLEAFSVGTPVVCNENVDPDGIIKKNILGITCKGYDEIPEAIQKIFVDINYERFYSNTQKYLKANHNYIKITQKFIRFLGANICIM